MTPLLSAMLGHDTEAPVLLGSPGPLPGRSENYSIVIYPLSYQISFISLFCFYPLTNPTCQTRTLRFLLLIFVWGQNPGLNVSHMIGKCPGIELHTQRTPSVF